MVIVVVTLAVARAVVEAAKVVTKEKVAGMVEVVNRVVGASEMVTEEGGLGRVARATAMEAERRVVVVAAKAVVAAVEAPTEKVVADKVVAVPTEVGLQAAAMEATAEAGLATVVVWMAMEMAETGMVTVVRVVADLMAMAIVEEGVMVEAEGGGVGRWVVAMETEQARRTP